MKVCPTCQRNYPDLISTCPDDKSILTDAASARATGKSSAGAAAAAKPAKEPVDTRTLEEKLFAPLPKREPAQAPVAPKPPAPSASATGKMQAATPAASATGKMPATGKLPETVFDDAPQKSSKIAAMASAQDIPWNKVGIAIAAVAILLIAGFLALHKSPAPPPASTLDEAPNAADVDMELNLRETLGKNAALRNQNIDLRVNNGTVILTGEASSTAKIEQAIKAAKAMPGVHEVISHIQVNPEVGVRSVGHGGSTAAGLGSADISSEAGLATQAKARDLTVAGDRAMSHGDYKSAASFYKQALALNPDDTAASVGYTQAMEKLQ
jgi:hypothetical protein